MSTHLKPEKKDASMVTLLAECPICLCLFDGRCSIRRLACGHMFCLQCCVDHILTRLASRVSIGQSRPSKLKSHLTPLSSVAMDCLQCDVLIDMETVQSLLEQRAEDTARFLRFALSDFVVSHPLLRWCPGPNCTIVFQVNEPQAKKVSCSKCSSSCWYGNLSTIYTL